jgi:beta-galactosidase
MKFPEGFKWGTAISAFQTEMGTSDESVSSNSDWYVWVHDEGNIKDGLVSGDLPEKGDGFWDLYRLDIKNASMMGNNSFRLSVDWARIFPETTESVYVDVDYEGDKIADVSLPERSLKEMLSICNQKAIEHYRDIFKFIKDSGLSVLLTIYHWPLPLWLHDPIACYKSKGECDRAGWLDEKTIIEFGKYAHFVSWVFSKYVDVWETINEPDVIATQGYLFGVVSGFPPGISDINKTIQVERNLALAHNVAYKSIKRINRNSEVGVGTAPQYFEPADDSPESKKLVRYISYLNNEWFLNAVNFGIFDNNIDMLFDERMEKIAPPDYIGIDYYQRLKIRHTNVPGLPYLYNMELLPCEDCSDFKWDIFPAGMREVCKEIFDRYHRPIYILENGVADAEGKKRQRFLVEHLKQLEMVISEDGIPVKGYYHWSLIDNYEWAKGFSMRFGLYRVDYKTKERHPTEAVELYRRICTGEYADVD